MITTLGLTYDRNAEGVREFVGQKQRPRLATLTAEEKKLFRDLNINNVPMADRHLVKTLRRIGVYPYAFEDVKAYLDAIVAKKNEGRSDWGKVYWSWVPLEKYHNLLWSSGAERENGDFDGLHVYTKAIPVPVALTISQVTKAYERKLEFFVSDIQKFKDPFLAVRVPSSENMHVIERWDEPGFRSRVR